MTGETAELKPKRTLGVFTLAMMNVAVICTLRGLPMMAEEGFSLIFYYLVTVLVFLIPVSLISAELATGWPPHGPGGVYIWVREAFGERLGFVAIWLQWIQNVIWFPTVLSFIAFFVALGSLGELSTWIVGPSKGLYTTAEDGHLPPFLQYVNREGVPTHILIVQGGIVTVLAFIFLLMPNVSSSYWILSALCVLLYLIMYILLYCSAIRLRYSRPDVIRAYRVPLGNFGMWLVGGVGILGAMFAFAVGFFPPSQIETGSVFFYEAFLVIGILVMCAAPIIIGLFRKPAWAVLSS
ncbi:MAG: amino acid permease [Candidatus Tritonobacter lacicola]|nr:amino acid permease [Candidatus Tritonobacter lacicola]